MVLIGEKFATLNALSVFPTNPCAQPSLRYSVIWFSITANHKALIIYVTKSTFNDCKLDFLLKVIVLFLFRILVLIVFEILKALNLFTELH